MAARPHVAEVHDLHIWEITTEMPAASAHVLVEPRRDCHAVRADLEDLLSQQYGISRLTLQVDHLPDTAARALGRAGRRTRCRDTGTGRKATRPTTTAGRTTATAAL
jgi:cobalt-zinc-cadmium efflux system protein